MKMNLGFRLQLKIDEGVYHLGNFMLWCVRKKRCGACAGTGIRVSERQAQYKNPIRHVCGDCEGTGAIKKY